MMARANEKNLFKGTFNIEMHNNDKINRQNDNDDGWYVHASHTLTRNGTP